MDGGMNDELKKLAEDPLKEIFGEAWMSLTPRRKQIIEMLIYKDVTYQQIANELGLSKQTISNTIREALSKLGIWRTKEIYVLIIEEFRNRAKGE